MQKKWKILFIFLIVVALAIAGLPTVANAQGGDPTTLVIGGRAEVVYSPSFDRVNLRSGAGIDHTIIRELHEGETGTVLAGPSTADGYTWWQIRWDNGNTGWAAVGDATRDWIVGIDSNESPSSVTITVRFTPATCRVEVLTTGSWKESDLAAFQAAASELCETFESLD